MNYYNEWDKFAAEWLRELIKDGLIPDGIVDERSIADVEPSELREFTQCHFFAGIGGWSRALQIAGWPADRPVWTGSPPCQSFSTAGKQKGKDDERHLWPVFFNLIRECQPSAVFGEQVAAAIRHGWLDDLQSDFEKEGYASGAVVLPAGGIGAYHKRDRLFFSAKRMADTTAQRQRSQKNIAEMERARRGEHGSVEPRATALAYTNDSRLQGHRGPQQEHGTQGREDSSGFGRSSSEHGLMGYPNSDRPQQRDETSKTARHWDSADAASLWADPKIIYCRDGKYRPIPTEPALFPLADGIPNRVGILRGAGNAIVPQAAAEIIKGYLECYQ